MYSSYYEKVGGEVQCIDDNVPFELPEGWSFMRLKSAWELISGRDLSPSEYNDESNGIPYIMGQAILKTDRLASFAGLLYRRFLRMKATCS